MVDEQKTNANLNSTNSKQVEEQRVLIGLQQKQIVAMMSSNASLKKSIDKIEMQRKVALYVSFFLMMFWLCTLWSKGHYC